MPEKEWFDDKDNRISLAETMVTVGELTDPIDVVRFFEKPWNYTYIFEWWDHSDYTDSVEEWVKAADDEFNICKED